MYFTQQLNSKVKDFLLSKDLFLYVCVYLLLSVNNFLSTFEHVTLNASIHLLVCMCYFVCVWFCECDHL